MKLVSEQIFVGIKKFESVTTNGDYGKRIFIKNGKFGYDLEMFSILRRSSSDNEIRVIMQRFKGDLRMSFKKHTFVK